MSYQWNEHGEPRIPDLEYVRARLEYLRGEIRAEQISMGEISELQDLAKYIDPGDVELLAWAGVPEFPDEPDDIDDEERDYMAGASDQLPVYPSMQANKERQIRQLVDDRTREDPAHRREWEEIGEMLRSMQ